MTKKKIQLLGNDLKGIYLDDNAISIEERKVNTHDEKHAHFSINDHDRIALATKLLDNVRPGKLGTAVEVLQHLAEAKRSIGAIERAVLRKANRTSAMMADLKEKDL